MYLEKSNKNLDLHLNTVLDTIECFHVVILRDAYGNLNFKQPPSSKKFVPRRDDTRILCANILKAIFVSKP